jgi:iron complex outermembrane recepter protein
MPPIPIDEKKPQGRQTPSRAPRALAVALLTALATLPCASLAEETTSAGTSGNKPSTAQTPSHDGEADSAEVELKTVTVTARQSEERAVDVPFGISVIDGDQLESRHLQTVEGALRSVPGVEVSSWGDPNSANVLIRGVGSLYQVSQDDGSVALNVDGVPMSMRNVSLGTLDVEQVEVLKGPQGTLFGGNSLAGAINITTRKPTRYFEGHIRGEYGKDNQHTEEMVVSGPLSEHLSGRFALRNSGSDLWVDNAETGKPLARPTDQAFRGSLLWDNGTGTTALFRAEHEKNKHSPSLTILRPYGDPAKLDFTPGLFENNHKTVDIYSLEVNHDLSHSRLTSITAYSRTDFLGVKGYDKQLMQALYGYPIEYIGTDSSNERTVSQELRLSSLPSAPVFWVAGAYLSSTNRSFDSYYSANNRQNRDFKTDSYAAYGEVTYPLTEKWKVTGGLRHSWDKKRYDATYIGTSTVLDSRKLDENYTTGRVALSYAITPSVNIYGAFSRGYQSGGFSDFTTQVADSTPYKPAHSNALEVGFKTESTDHRLALNGALFLTKVKDAHLLGYDYTTMATSTINADTESKGAELEGTWQVGRGFELSGGVSYTDATITSDATGVNGGDVQSGNQVPNVPHWSGNLAVTYRKAIPEFMGLSTPVLNTRLSYQHVGARAADAQNHFDLGSYRKVDMRIGLISGNTEVYVYGNNLLNKQYDLYGYYFTPTVTAGAPARGRTFGVGAAYYF